MKKADTFAQSYIPPHAITCWVDESFVYTALPTKSGPPFIQKYALTEGGLTKALTVLKVARRDLGRGHQTRETKIRIDRNSKDHFTDPQREKARSILRKLGMIPQS